MRVEGAAVSKSHAVFPLVHLINGSEEATQVEKALRWQGCPLSEYIIAVALLSSSPWFGRFLLGIFLLAFILGLLGHV